VLKGVIKEFGVMIKVIFIDKIGVIFCKNITAVKSVKRRELKAIRMLARNDIFLLIG
jgi:hypothetical protein